MEAGMMEEAEMSGNLCMILLIIMHHFFDAVCA